MIKGETYSDRLEHQLDEWVKGNPIHNEVDGECCPDFSCCNSHLLADQEVRDRFKLACMEIDDETKSEMLGMFLGGLVDGKKAYIAGLTVPEQEH